MFFSNMDFNFTHFANFNSAHFETARIFVNLGKITTWFISLANFYFGYLKGSHFKHELYFSSFCV